jgi:hypothetical protein
MKKIVTFLFLTLFSISTNFFAQKGMQIKADKIYSAQNEKEKGLEAEYLKKSADELVMIEVYSNPSHFK